MAWWNGERTSVFVGLGVFCLVLLFLPFFFSRIGICFQHLPLGAAFCTRLLFMLTFVRNSDGQHKHFGLKARVLIDSSAELQAAFAKIEAIEKCDQHRAQLKGWVAMHGTAAADQAPTTVQAEWVQDTTSNSCLGCKAQFKRLLRRRHHCRFCGLLVYVWCPRDSIHLSPLCLSSSALFITTNPYPTFFLFFFSPSFSCASRLSPPKLQRCYSFQNRSHVLFFFSFALFLLSFF